MLYPHECSVGCVGDVTTLSLVLPRDTFEATVLVAPAGESMVGVVLDGEHPYISIECGRDDTNWSGLLVPNVSIELDETTVFDARSSSPLGSLIRTGTRLAISARAPSAMRNHLIPIVPDLPPCRESFSAGFRRWRVIIGDGLSKRELKAINIS
ncbi:MAG: hypothetical protein QOJ86_4994 [Bradyrhizobium sp.]|jgi:hypothetical protein|nr:hypothetical protein [Bradyrhizobium sp.]